MHYFDAEKAMKGKFGENTILVKDELKIAHYIKTLGEPITTIMANTKMGTFQYAVFVRDLPCSPLPTKESAQASQTVVQEQVAAKSSGNCDFSDEMADIPEPTYDIQTPPDMLAKVQVTEGTEKVSSHLSLRGLLTVHGGRTESIK